jgi:hypothetical protein
MRTVIHRDKTLTFNGERYQLIAGGPGWGWEIHTLPDLNPVADGFFTLREVRDYVDMARGQRWDRLGEDRV